jgi:high-affinity iron transporter
MAGAFLIALRDGLEAALIVGIICAYLVKLDRRDALPKVVLGTVLAVLLSLVIGVVIVNTIGRLDHRLQATLEGIAALAAVVIMTRMLFWMRAQGRAIKGELESQVSTALALGSTRALIGLVFIAVIREGLEMTLFFLAIIGSESGDATSAVIGGLMGLAVAVVLGWAIFAAGIRINLGRFFKVTGVLLIFVAAGLMVYAVNEFTEAGWLPVFSPVFDFSSILPQSSLIGSVLTGMFGYRAQPTGLQIAAYLLYLVPVLFLYLSDWRPSLRRGAVASA